MIEKEIENEPVINNLEIVSDIQEENQEAEKITTPKKDTKRKQARIIYFNLSAKKNVFVKVLDDAIKICQEENEQAVSLIFLIFKESPTKKAEKVLNLIDKEVTRKLELYKLFEIYHEMKEVILKKSEK
jgi:hypothetical protein